MKRVIISSNTDLHDRVQNGLKKYRNDVLTPEEKDLIKRAQQREEWKRSNKAKSDLIGSNGQYAYKGFTMLKRGNIWEVRLEHSNDVIRECRSLKECMQRIDNQTI